MNDMKTKLVTLSVFLGMLVMGCDGSDEVESGGPSPSAEDAYGDEEIGIRGGSEDGKLGEAPDQEGDWSADGAGEGEGEGEWDTDSEPPQYASLIDPSFLEGEEWGDPWFGMIYEGEVSSSLEYPTSYVLAAGVAGTMEGQSFLTEQCSVNLLDDSDSLFSFIERKGGDVPVAKPSPAEVGDTVAQRDDFVIGSLFDKQKLAQLAVVSEASMGFPTLVVRNRYDVVLADQGATGDFLRSICVMAGHTVSQDGDSAIAGMSRCFVQDNGFEAGEVVSLAQTLPLTLDSVEVAARYEDDFANKLPGFAGATDLCLCYAEDGVTPVECPLGERGRALRHLPPPAQVSENPYFTSADMPATTFSIDVDTASYTLARQAMNNGALPEPESVRIEELINYFDFNYARPEGSDPFTVYTEIGVAPWNPSHQLALVGLRGQEIAMEDQPAANLVYLLDVSGSMYEELPFIQAAFRLLTNQLRDEDTLSIVTYAGADAVVLDGGTGKNKDQILAAIDSLSSGGSTAGAAGIVTAYEIARKHFKSGGNNRVILATDGDFNVGVSSDEALVELIEAKRNSGVFLTVYGFSTWGSGNFQDSKMEQLADHGNGTYFFIDGEAEARRAFMHSLSGTLLTIAKDVKIQIQFNPSKIKGYRLIGYDNRMLNNDDFDNDSVDAGELGNSEAVTALLELIPADSAEAVPVPESPAAVEEEEEAEEFDPLPAGDLMAVRLRFKNPDSEQSELITHPVTSARLRTSPTPKFVFASTIAQVGLALRQSAYLEDQNISSLPDRIRAVFEDESQPAIAELLAFLEAAAELLPSER